MATYARALLAAAAIATVACAPKAELGVAKERSEQDDEWRTRFQDWTIQHGKEYESVEEWESRLVTFVSNAEYVREYNAKHSSHWLGLNALADLSQDEFRSKYLGMDPLMGGELQDRANTPFKYENVEIGKVPESIDWREKGAVTHVKNQGICGSCWSFSTTGSVEGINAIYSGDLVVLSEQELIDCDITRDHGCHGGLMDFAFKFILQNGGIATEADYPYTMNQGTCRNIRTTVTIDGYEDVPANNEVALMKAVAHQPVSVAVQANTRAFQLYSGGVFDSPDCGTALDHGVLVVGYGAITPSNSNKKEDYWIVKNSWGTMWGEEGYIRIARNVDEAEGMCGIAMMPSYPTKDEPNPPPGPRPSPTPSPSPGPGPSPGPTPVPPGPGPVQCSNGQQCPPGGTCCCLFQFSGTCLIYGCCPYPEAICCDDHVHCCPKDHPVCDAQGGGCKASNAENAVSVPLGVKSLAKNTFSRSNPLLLQGKHIQDQE